MAASSQQHTFYFAMNKLEADFSNPYQCQIYVDSSLSIDGVDLYLTKQEALRLALMLHAYATGRFDGGDIPLPAVDEYKNWGGDDVPVPPGNSESDL